MPQTGGVTYPAHILHSAFTELPTGKEDFCSRGLKPRWMLSLMTCGFQKGDFVQVSCPHLASFSKPHFKPLGCTFWGEHYCLTQISDNNRVCLILTTTLLCIKRTFLFCKHYWLLLYLRCWWRAHRCSYVRCKMFTFFLLHITSKIVF